MVTVPACDGGVIQIINKKQLIKSSWIVKNSSNTNICNLIKGGVFHYAFTSNKSLSLSQCMDGVYPAELWLGVSRTGVCVYKQGEAWPLEVFSYEAILSFGAPQSNIYKISVEGRDLFFQTTQVMQNFPHISHVSEAS